MILLKRTKKGDINIDTESNTQLGEIDTDDIDDRYRYRCRYTGVDATFQKKNQYVLSISIHLTLFSISGLA